MWSDFLSFVQSEIFGFLCYVWFGVGEVMGCSFYFVFNYIIGSVGLFDVYLVEVEWFYFGYGDFSYYLWFQVYDFGCMGMLWFIFDMNDVVVLEGQCVWVQYYFFVLLDVFFDDCSGCIEDVVFVYFEEEKRFFDGDECLVFMGYFVDVLVCVVECQLDVFVLVDEVEILSYLEFDV